MKINLLLLIILLLIIIIYLFVQYDDSVTVNNSPNQTKTPSKKLLLTDGWYSIQALIDQAMIKHVISGKVKVGTKLLTYGSELLNCDQGYSPLEVNIFLNIFLSFILKICNTRQVVNF